MPDPRALVTGGDPVPTRPFQHRSTEFTPLTPEEEPRFQQWIRDNQITDLDHPDSHYDYRGFWRATRGAPHPPGSVQHFPDTYKQHGHPTFSRESQYSRNPNDGGMWVGDHLIQQPKMSVTPRPLVTGRDDVAARTRPIAQRLLDPPVEDTRSPWSKAETIGPDTSRGGRERTAVAEWEAGAPFEADRPPTLRPPTTSEWLRGRAQGALESLADVLPLTEQLGATSFGAKAEELGDPRGKVLGAMPDAPSPKLSREAIREILSGVSVKEAPKVAKRIPIPEGLGNMGKILTRGERGSRRYPFAPAAAERAESIYHIGTSLPQRAQWSSVMDPEMLHAFENDPEIAKTYGALWASLSNQNPVPTNTAESVQVWLHRLQHPEDFPLHHTTLRAFPHKKVNLSTSKYGNVNRAFLGEPLSGPKVGPMSRYMQGEGTGFEAMTPDVHALYGSGVTRKNPAIAQELPHIRDLVTRTERLKRGALTPDELVEVWQNSLYDVLDRVDPGRKPDELFGDFWEGARAHKGEPFQGAVKDILRNRGLLEYGAMLDKQKLLRALRDKRGWSVGSALALMAMLDTEPEAEAAGPPPAPPPTS